MTVPTGPAAGAVRTLPVLGVEDVAEETFWLRFRRPDGVECEPGQFFMLSPVEPAGGVYLGRPFSIGDVRDGEWRFLLRGLGHGTRWMKRLPPGLPLRLVGPLGRPFARPAAPVHRLVAGGIGLAPFYWLARRLRAERPGARIELFYGERSAAAHVEFDAGEAGLFDHVERTTDDGSRGGPATVVDLADRTAVDGRTAWYACGPHPMLRALAGRLEARGTTGAQFSLEERMACGFGVCQACVAPRATGPERYRLLCTEGPVVDPREIAW